MPFSEHELLLRYPYRSAHPTLVDVGAHRGYFSLPFARRGWRVIAFEPEERNRHEFEQRLAGLDVVTCVPLAVSNQVGERVPFYTSSTHHGIHSLQPFHETHQLAYEVETTTLQAALPPLGVNHITLLKIDVEGADLLALQGCDLSVFQPELVMLEFMDSRSQAHFGYSHHDVVTYMRSAGYAAFVSAWTPITQYARDDVPGDLHTWLECGPYPLPYEPVWGNLIFVPEADSARFSRVLNAYVRNRRLRDRIKAISGIPALIRKLQRWTGFLK
jgi:FkbM family methyltransferase